MRAGRKAPWKKRKNKKKKKGAKKDKEDDSKEEEEEEVEEEEEEEEVEGTEEEEREADRLNNLRALLCIEGGIFLRRNQWTMLTTADLSAPGRRWCTV